MTRYKQNQAVHINRYCNIIHSKISSRLVEIFVWLLSTGLLQVVSTSCNKFANDKLQQAGEIDNLQQVYGIFGCVRRVPRKTLW